MSYIQHILESADLSETDKTEALDTYRGLISEQLQLLNESKLSGSALIAEAIQSNTQLIDELDTLLVRRHGLDGMTTI